MMLCISTREHKSLLVFDTPFTGCSQQDVHHIHQEQEDTQVHRFLRSNIEVVETNNIILSSVCSIPLYILSKR